MKFSFYLIVGFLFFCFGLKAQALKLKSNVPYHLESVFIGGKKNTLAKDKAEIVFHPKNKTSKCDMKCNYFELNYSSNKNAFKFTKIISGPKPCPDQLIGLESDLKENFSKVKSYLVEKNRIYFFNKKDTLMVFYE